MDMLVNLHSQHLAELGRRVDAGAARIRPALPPELHIIQDWVRDKFSDYWVSEVMVAMARQPPSCLVATLDGALVGFACYDTTARGFFGPTGVSETHRGKGIGQALLYHTMMAMKSQGYAYAVIGAVGPADFYTSAVGAVPIPGNESIYRDLLRVRKGLENQ